MNHCYITGINLKIATNVKEASRLTDHLIEQQASDPNYMFTKDYIESRSLFQKLLLEQNFLQQQKDCYSQGECA